MLSNFVRKRTFGEVIGEMSHNQPKTGTYQLLKKYSCLYVDLVGTVFMYIAFNIQCKP